MLVRIPLSYILATAILLVTNVAMAQDHGWASVLVRKWASDKFNCESKVQSMPMPGILSWATTVRDWENPPKDAPKNFTNPCPSIGDELEGRTLSTTCTTAIANMVGPAFVGNTADFCKDAKPVSKEVFPMDIGCPLGKGEKMRLQGTKVWCEQKLECKYSFHAGDSKTANPPGKYAFFCPAKTEGDPCPDNFAHCATQFQQLNTWTKNPPSVVIERTGNQ